MKKDVVDRIWKKGMAVFFRCFNPATGFIKRIYKDGIHVDVTWCADANCRQTKKTRISDIEPLTEILNQWLAVNPK